MLDLYSILKTQGRLDDIVVTMVGDLKYGRTVHSLLMALSQFRVKFNFVACDELKMPYEFLKICDEKGIDYTCSKDFSPEIINESDIIYMTRVQRERFTDLMEYERVKDLYTLHNAMLADSKPNLKILHPLPRVNEINQDVDDNPKAYYFQQAKNGLYARQAMICSAMQIDPAH
jgi:aspartate carbamoyltransferase catalytic subunit